MDVPEEYCILFHSSATEIWERLLQNCVRSTSYHYVNGSFSERFFKAAQSLQLHPSQTTSSWGEGFAFDPTAIPADVEMINFTHNETSTGTMLAMEYIAAFRQSHPEALISLDMVSSAPYGKVNWKDIDAAYFSVQKCFGMPAGLGVLIASPRIIEKAKQLEAEGKSIGTYHSFLKMVDKYQVNQTVETPNMLGIYVLGKVCEEMNQKGIEVIREETDAKAKKLYEYFEAHPTYDLFVEDKDFRSPTVIIVNIPEGSLPLINYLAKHDIVMGNGYAKTKGKVIRIANFPSVTMADVERLLNLIDQY